MTWLQPVTLHGEHATLEAIAGEWPAVGSNLEWQLVKWGQSC